MKKLLVFSIGILVLTFVQATYAQQQWFLGEYFIGKDPGVGKATSFSILATEQSKLELNQSIEIDVSNLKPGFYSLGLRTLGLSKKSLSTPNNPLPDSRAWSTTEFRTFYVSPPPVAANTAPLSKAEYFFGKDPGANKGTPITGLSITNNGIDLSATNFEIPVSNLNSGFHQLCIRAGYNNGEWSHIENRTFYIPLPRKTVSSNIVAAQYFFDGDQGLASAKNINIDFSLAKDTDGVITLPMFQADVAGLARGFHQIGIRVKNADGQWSLVESRTFYIAPSIDERQSPKLVSAEYFIDPKFSDGLPVQPIVSRKFAPADSISINDQEFDISGLDFGDHTLAVRVRDEKGNYSFLRDTIFRVTDCPVFPVADIKFRTLARSNSSIGMCVQDSALFTPEVKGGNAQTTYAWDFDGNGTVDSDSKNPVKFIYPRVGTYKAFLTTSNGGKCFSKDSVTVEIASRPTTRPVVTSRNDTLLATPSTNIRWYDSQLKPIPNAIGAIYSPIAEGKYYATTGNGKGCESDTSMGIVFVPVLPTASMLSTTYTVTEGDPVNISVSLTGTSPWTLYAKANGVALPAFNVTRSPYNWQVFTAGTYTLDSLVDGKSRKGRVSGNVTVVVRQFVGATANTETKEYILRTIADTAKVKVSLRGTAPFTLYLSYEGVERIITDIRDTAFVFKTFLQGSYRLTRVFDATGNQGKVNGSFTVKFQSVVNTINASISGSDTLRGISPANVIFNFTGKAPWTVLWSIDDVPFPTPLVIRKSPDTLKVFKDGAYKLLSVIDAEGNQALVSGVAKIVKPAVPQYTGIVSGNGSLNESDTIYITFKYNGNLPWTLIYGNDLGFIDTVVVPTNEYVAKVYNRGVYRIIKIIDGKVNIPSEIITKGEAKVELELVTKDAFSPNDDGLNDFFVFKGLSLFELNKLFIYNREGQAIFNSDNYQNQWDGKDMNGKFVPDGVYYYTLKSSNKTNSSEQPLETYGFIEIRR